MIDQIRSMVAQIRLGIDQIRSLLDQIRSLVDQIRLLMDQIRLVMDQIRLVMDQIRFLVDRIRSMIHIRKARIRPDSCDILFNIQPFFLLTKTGKKKGEMTHLYRFDIQCNASGFDFRINTKNVQTEIFLLALYSKPYLRSDFFKNRCRQKL